MCACYGSGIARKKLMQTRELLKVRISFRFSYVKGLVFGTSRRLNDEN